jgi:two-component system, chemotaxis family, protein-glutamate methylesterase/glutaminase
VSSAGPGRHDLVVVGVSWGGLAALRTLLAGLPTGFAAPVVVVQHRSPESHPTALRELLAAATPLTVCEVGDKQPLERGTLYLAPPDYHTLVEGDHLELSVDAAVAHSRPSIDVLFESAAEAHRERCAGVVLTGANADGAAGLARIAALGGAALVQDPATAERVEMPRAAIAAVPTARVAPLAEIAGLLVELCTEPGVAVH